MAKKTNCSECRCSNANLKKVYRRVEEHPVILFMRGSQVDSEPRKKPSKIEGHFAYLCPKCFDFCTSSKQSLSGWLSVSYVFACRTKKVAGKEFYLFDGLWREIIAPIVAVVQ